MTSEEIKPSKKSRKKAVIISASVAAVLFLGALGYFGWKYYAVKQSQLDELKQQMENLKKESDDLTNQVTTDENQGNEEQNGKTADEYAGWNTYNNYEVGYQLKYPADWAVKETNEYSELLGNDVKFITITTADKKYFLYWGLKYKDDDFGISDRTGVGAGDLIQEGSVIILGTDTSVKKLAYKSKVKEYFFPGTGSTKTADGKYSFGAALSPGSGVNYDSLNMQGIPELGKSKLILASVIIIPRTVPLETGCASTLTLTDKLAIKNWKTFKNDKYDYSFKYPEDWDYDKVSDKLINFEGDDDVVFSWRSEEMTVLGYEGWDFDTTKNLKVACQSAKSTYLEQGDERMIFTQFKKGGKDHMTNFGYKYIGASMSSDMVEMYDLILKSVEFED